LLLILGGSLVFQPFQGILSLATIATCFIGAKGVLRLISAYQVRESYARKLVMV
jgi:uncharacterized membrane protein HdeD (DUF308 family)